MKPKTTLYLFVFLVSLWAAYWAMLRIEDSSEQAEIKAKKVFDFAEQDIASVELLPFGERVISASRSSEGKWSIEKPFSTIRPNQNVWSRISKALSELTNERSIETEPQNLEIYGLTESQLKMKVKLDSGTDIELKFGMLDPTQINRYAQIGSRKEIFLIADRAYAEFNRTLNELRFPQVFEVPEDGIHGIEYVRLKKGVDGTIIESELKVVVENNNGVWSLKKPISATANQEKVQELATRLQYIVGYKHVDNPESLSDYNLDVPGAKVTIVLSDGSRQGLLLSIPEGLNEDGRFYVKREEYPEVFAIDGDLWTLVPQNPYVFQEKRLFIGDGTKINKIHYTSGEVDLKFEKDREKGWQMVQPAVADTNEIAVSNLIALLKTTEANRFPGDVRPEYGLKAPQMSVSFEMEGEEKPVIIKVGAALEDPEKGYFYAVQDSGTVVTISEASVSRLRWTAFDFRKKDLMSFSKSSVNVAKIILDSKEYVFRKNKGKWSVELPQGAFLESQSDITTILEALSSNSILAIEAQDKSADPAVFGLDKPVLIALVSIESTVGKGESVAPLMIGSVCEDNSQQRYARIEGRDEILRVSQKVIDDIREALKGVR